MKKIVIAFALLGVAFSASAQNMYDAMMFSENNYYGTARSLALGNAVTAIGGDLGSIGINPAGSAVAGYSQFTLTPGLSFSNTSSTYMQFGKDAEGTNTAGTGARFGMPNLGFIEYFETGNSYGIKAFSFGIVSNRTTNYNSHFNSFGRNPYTSRFGEYAVAATGYTPYDLGNGNRDAYYDSSAAWDLITAYRSNLISGYNDAENFYAGSTEFVPEGGVPYVPGALNQVVDVRSYGSKQDIVLNFGMNMNDNFYLGFNLGIPAATYRYEELYTETPVNPDLFPISFAEDGKTTVANFEKGTMEYERRNEIDGIYAKAGFIWLPTNNLRVGASIQTPTAYTIKEMWSYSGASDFSESRFSSSELSELGEYTYCLRSPYVADFGVAFTFGGRGFISADYELTDYSVMRFSELHEYMDDYDYFYDLNETNRLFAGLAHSLRVGAEIKLTPAFAVRAGYTLLTNPERHYTNNYGEDVNASAFLNNFDDYQCNALTLNDMQYYKERTSSISLGIGYSSPGSFFMDLAARRTSYPESNYAPYYDYENFNAEGVQTNYASPRILNLRNSLDVVMTLGFRF